MKVQEVVMTCAALVLISIMGYNNCQSCPQKEKLVFARAQNLSYLRDTKPADDLHLSLEYVMPVSYTHLTLPTKA